VSLLVFTGLPLITDFLHTHLNVPVARNNLLVAQTSLSALAIGCAGIAAAPNIAMLIPGKALHLITEGVVDRL
jgi:hypothetical protein